MSDVIKEAIRSHKNNREKVARGEVNDCNIQLVKRETLFRWKLDIQVNGKTEDTLSGSAYDMDREFKDYVYKYDLEEVDD